MMEARPSGEEGDRSVLEGSGPDLGGHMNWRLAVYLASGRLLTKNRLLKKAVCGVLASLKPSTYLKPYDSGFHLLRPCIQLF